MDRVLVAGMPGAGTSTLARRLGKVGDLPYAESEALFHGPAWVPRASFLDDVRALAAAPRWVTEWQHDRAGDLLLKRADTVVWLDYDRRVVVGRTIWRSALRSGLRRRTFDGDVERWRDWSAPDHPVRWARTHTENVRRDIGVVLQSAGHVNLLRLRAPAETRRWLRWVKASRQAE